MSLILGVERWVLFQDSLLSPCCGSGRRQSHFFLSLSCRSSMWTQGLLLSTLTKASPASPLPGSPFNLWGSESAPFLQAHTGLTTPAAVQASSALGSENKYSLSFSFSCCFYALSGLWTHSLCPGICVNLPFGMKILTPNQIDKKRLMHMVQFRSPKFLVSSKLKSSNKGTPATRHNSYSWE